MKSARSPAERRQLREQALPIPRVLIEVDVCLSRRFVALPNDEPATVEPDWVEAWHPSHRTPLSIVLPAVRNHQSRFGGQIDVGFLPTIDGACHVVGRRSHVLRAVTAVCESEGLTLESWQFTQSHTT